MLVKTLEIAVHKGLHMCLDKSKLRRTGVLEDSEWLLDTLAARGSIAGCVPRNNAPEKTLQMLDAIFVIFDDARSLKLYKH